MLCGFSLGWLLHYTTERKMAYLMLRQYQVATESQTELNFDEGSTNAN